MSSVSSGKAGEDVTVQLLEYEGWTLQRQVHIGAVTVDLVGTHPLYPETLFEVKVWTDPKSGRDTVKKALADAYYLQATDEERPYVLVLSHQLTQGYRDMISAALKAGAISEVRIIGFIEFQS
jgi:hypothetical protein